MKDRLRSKGEAEKPLKDASLMLSLLRKEAVRLGMEEGSLGPINGHDMVYFEGGKGSTRVLISAGIHGPEIAGPWGLYCYLASLDELPTGAHLTVLPMLNPIGIDRQSRGNKLGQNPNTNLVVGTGGKPSREGDLLLAAKRFLMECARNGELSLHEDYSSNKFYIYSFESSKAPGRFSAALVETGRKYFELAEDGFDPSEEKRPRVKDGIIFHDHDGSFEDMMFHLGAAHTAVIETPQRADFGRRVSCQADCIKTFIRMSQLGMPIMKTAQDKEAPGRSAWQRVRDFVGRHKAALALGVGGLAAGGVVGHRLLSKAAPPSGPVAKRLRALAEKGGITFATATSKKRGQSPGMLDRLKSFFRLAGSGKARYTDEYGKPLKKEPAPAGVTAGFTPHTGMKTKGDVMLGGLPSGRRRAAAARTGEKIQVGGKMSELHPRYGFAPFMTPGMSVSQLAKKHGMRIPSHKSSLEEKAAFLKNIQAIAKKHYKYGFLFKPHDLVGQAGAFPSHKGDWGKQFTGYHTEGLKDQIEALKKQPSMMSWEHGARKTFGKHKHYPGLALTEVFKHPSRIKLEPKLKTVTGSGGKPVEYRVHMVGGEVPEELAWPRYSIEKGLLKEMPGIKSLLGRKSHGSSAEAAEWVRKEVAPHIPKEHKAGTYGLDVIRVKHGRGKYGWKIVELNPTGRATGSGFLDPQVVVNAPHRLYKYIHGKDAPVVTAGKALAAGAGAGGITLGGAHLLGKKQEDKQDDQPLKRPVPHKIEMPKKAVV